MATAGAKRVLVLDDDEILRSLLVFSLEGEGYRVTGVETGREMLSLLDSTPFDLLILDLGLPDEDGIVLTRKVRARSTVPIVILTGRKDKDSLYAALELGADDYVTKPFDPWEVLLRVRNVLGRVDRQAAFAAREKPREIRFHGWSFDPDGRHLKAPDGGEVPLTPGEARILAALIASAGRAVSRDRLLDVVADGDEAPSARMIDVYVTQLRAKIEADRKRPELILTVREVGYRFGGRID